MTPEGYTACSVVGRTLLATFKFTPLAPQVLLQVLDFASKADEQCGSSDTTMLDELNKANKIKSGSWTYAEWDFLEHATSKGLVGYVKSALTQSPQLVSSIGGVLLATALRIGESTALISRNGAKVVPMLSMLLQHGISPNVLLSNRYTSSEVDIQHGWTLMEKFVQRSGYCEEWLVEMTRTLNLLFGHGFDPNEPGDDGRTPWMKFVQQAHLRGFEVPKYVTAVRYNLAKLFLRYGADPFSTFPRFLTWEGKTVSEVIRNLSRLTTPQAEHDPHSLEEVLGNEIAYVESRVTYNRKRPRTEPREPQKWHRYNEGVMLSQRPPSPGNNFLKLAI